MALFLKKGDKVSITGETGAYKIRAINTKTNTAACDRWDGTAWVPAGNYLLANLKYKK